MATKIEYAEDEVSTVGKLVRLRIPSLMIGLVLGIFLSVVTSRFEEVLSENVRIAYFLPFIVYMADAVGTQTQNIYARDLKTRHAKFKKYIVKETLIGVILGAVSSVVAGIVAELWYKSVELTLAVSIAMFAAIALAPIVALLVTQFLQLEHKDPAVGAGPIATVLQDTFSVLIFGIIASAIIL